MLPSSRIESYREKMLEFRLSHLDNKFMLRRLKLNDEMHQNINSAVRYDMYVASYAVGHLCNALGRLFDQFAGQLETLDTTPKSPHPSSQAYTQTPPSLNKSTKMSQNSQVLIDSGPHTIFERCIIWTDLRGFQYDPGLEGHILEPSLKTIVPRNQISQVL